MPELEEAPAVIVLEEPQGPVQALLAAGRLEEEVRGLEARIKALKARRDRYLDAAEDAAVLEAVPPWGGSYRLTYSVRKVREVDAAAALKAYPDELLDLISLPVGKAEEAIGKKRLEQFVSLKESRSRSLKYVPADGGA